MRSNCCGAPQYGETELCSECKEWSEFQDDTEKMIDDALALLRNSSLRDDDGGLEEEILSGDISEERWNEIFLQLRANQLRPIDLPNFNQTDWAKSYKRNF